jgi:hypothetical protein
MVIVGAWENEEFIGVVLFSKGANPNFGKPYGLNTLQVCELTRVALKKHITPVSQVIAGAIEKLKEIAPGLRLVISYADADQNHKGKIYQAGNWIYEGLLKKDTVAKFYLLGRERHLKSIGSWLKPKYPNDPVQSLPWLRANIDPNVREIRTKGKHKYLMPLDKQIRRKLLKLHKPYPKG